MYITVCKTICAFLTSNCHYPQLYYVFLLQVNLQKMAIKMITIKDIKQEMEDWRCRVTVIEVLPPREGDRPIQKYVLADEEVK